MGNKRNIGRTLIHRTNAIVTQSTNKMKLTINNTTITIEGEREEYYTKEFFKILTHGEVLDSTARTTGGDARTEENIPSLRWMDCWKPKKPRPTSHSTFDCTIKHPIIPFANRGTTTGKTRRRNKLKRKKLTEDFQKKKSESKQITATLEQQLSFRFNPFFHQ